MERRRGTPSPISCPWTVPGEWLQGGEAKLSVRETVTGGSWFFRFPWDLWRGHGDLGVERLARADVFGVQHRCDG